VTSSDIIDTGFSIQLRQTGEIIKNELKILLKNLKAKSLKYKKTAMIGRSHGIHAEPITFGLKLGSFYNEFKRNLKRLELAIEEISICSISGPVGTYESIDPRVEKYVAKKLKLNSEDISTQIIPRDRHAFFFSVLGIIASSIERFAVEIRHLQRTELLEVEEKFSSKQKGSSAMPHKRNPVLSENLTGLARYIRSAVIPSMENIVLWHERDISHSSVERIMAPDISIALDFSLNRLNEIVKTMTVYPENMEKNLYKLNGVIFSQNVLLKLTQKGMSREESYRIVQKNALKAVDDDVSFKDLLLNDKETMYVLSSKELDQIFDISRYFKHVDTIFKRIFS
jgi:adenylosuccinate lyase